MTDKINQAAVNMLDWFNSWRQEDGAYNGWVVHRFDLKRLKYVHDTPWEQTPMIDGLLNLYRATGNRKYYLMARESVELQISRIDQKTGMFDNAGFEDDRFSSLVHNALADCALLSFCECCEAEDSDLKARALDTVSKNLELYFMGDLYCPEAEAFKFSHIDYYWQSEDRFVANMNSVAIEAMMRYAALSGEKKYIDISLRAMKSVISLFSDGTNTLQDGGIAYANTHPNWYISIYTALALRGICEVYKYNRDENLKNILIRSAEHLIKYTEDGYFCHAIQDGICNPYPYWVAGGGMILKGIDDVERVTGVRFDTAPFVEKIISHQQKCGGISSFLKYNSKDNHRRKDAPEKDVWENVAPGPPWNAHFFEYLTRHIDASFDSLSPQNGTSFIWKPRYIYFENKKTFFVCSAVPLFSCALVWINKKKDVSIIGFSLRNTYAKLRKLLKGEK